MTAVKAVAGKKIPRLRPCRFKSGRPHQPLRNVKKMSADALKSSARALLAQGHNVLLHFMLAANPTGLSADQKKKAKAVAAEGLPFKQAYQRWYTVAVQLIKAIAPERAAEFVELYKADPRRKHTDWRNYAIEDYILGMVCLDWSGENSFEPDSVFSAKFQSQLMILESAVESMDSKLRDIRSALQFELFDDELAAASDLLKKGHLRAAGAVAGVVLEGHLGEVCNLHNVTFRKKNLTISEYNDALKDGSIIDVPMWRYIQRLGDIRNLSVHQKDRDPKKDEIEDLIIGTKKIIAEVI